MNHRWTAALGGVAIFGACRCSPPPASDPGAADADAGTEAAADSWIDAGASDTPDVASDESSLDASVGWRAVTEAPGCPLFQADLGLVKIAPLTWAPCGSGCQVSSSGLSKYPSQRGTSAGRYADGETYLLLDEPVDAGVRLRTVRVADGVTRAAVELRTTTVQCLPLGAGHNAFHLAFAGPKGSKTFTVARTTAAGDVAWPKTWVSLPGVPQFTFEWGGGYAMALDDGTVRSFSLPSATGLELLGGSEGSSFNADGFDDLAVWVAPDPGGTGRRVVRGFHLKRALAETYVARADLSLIGAALSADRLVVMGVAGPEASEGRYTSVRFLWSAKPARPSDVVLTDGSSIPVDTGALTVRTAGDFAAVMGCHAAVSDNKACTLYVAQISTKKTWTINPRPGEGFAKLMAVSPTELVIGVVDYPLTAISRKEMHRFLRLDLGKLDALALAWP